MSRSQSMAGPRARGAGADALARYRAKRDFKVTSEPRGGRATAQRNSFVVQKHAASRLHYDFRLELNGTMKSWAVTRGPSVDPADKRLAVHVEDHPIDYAGFEGIIPKGQYGGGTVMIWDRGTWEPIEDPVKGYASGKLKFALHGDKLKGGWTLVRMGGRARSERADNWLLIKERDAEARPGHGDILLEEETRSVTTGRSMDEIAAKADRIWTQDGEQNAPADLKKTTTTTKAKTSGKKGALPQFVAPQLATLVDQPPEGVEWLHEIKLDGYRMLCRVADGKLRFLTRTGQNWTDRFPTLAKSRIAAATALIDGEIVAVDKNGFSNFGALQQALSEGSDQDLQFHAFDLPHLDGADLRKETLETRKARLKILLSSSRQSAPRFAFSGHIDGRGKDVFAQACALSLEGIVSKRRDAPYRPGRGEDWLKAKCGARQEFVIGGFTEHSKSTTSVGALLVGYYQDGDLVYSGRVGTGFDAKTRKELRRELDALRRRSSPFASTPAATRRGAIWVNPRLVAEIAYSNWTRDGILRHPSFQGLRTDKPPEAIVREKPKPVVKAGKPARARRASHGPDTVAGVVLTHPERVLYPDQGLTKHNLAEYYVAVAEAMLPHLAGRPLSLVRCPEGAGAACFYQKHPGNSAPKALRRIKIKENAGTHEYVVADDVGALVALVQMGVLEIHPWGSREDHLEQPDRIIFDFDPAPDVPWSRVVSAAGEMRARLESLGLESFLKTTGGKGLHVVAPIAPRESWPEVKAFTKAVASAVERDAPRDYTTVMSKAERRGRIFIDYLRNDRGSTAIAPYSTRARAGAPVATPLAWNALKPGLEPGAFTVLTIPGRLKMAKADPWEGMATLRQGITAKAKAAVSLK